MIGRASRLLSTPPRVLARILLVLGALLLFAQWGAVAHAHTHDHAPPVQHSHAGLCDECPNFAPLLAGAADTSPAFPVPIPPLAVSCEEIALAFPDESLILGFRSRAPPNLPTV